MTSERVGRLRHPDMLFSVGFCILFAWALWASFAWPFKAAIFPRIVDGLGLAFALVYIGVLLLQRRDAEPAADASTAGPLQEPEEGFEEFASAAPSQWISALAWSLGFFVFLYLLGLLIAAPLFSYLYLTYSAHASKLFSLVYALLMEIVLYVGFARLLETSMPVAIWS